MWISRSSTQQNPYFLIFGIDAQRKRPSSQENCFLRSNRQTVSGKPFWIFSSRTRTLGSQRASLPLIWGASNDSKRTSVQDYEVASRRFSKILRPASKCDG